MKRYLLDTNVVSDLVRKRKPVVTGVAAAVARGDRVGVPIPALGELFAWVEFSSRQEQNRTRLLRAISRLVIWPNDRAAAEEYGRVFAELHRVGRPIQQVDMQIAAIALSLGNCTVVTRDSDLAAVPRLTVETWET